MALNSLEMASNGLLRAGGLNTLTIAAVGLLRTLAGVAPSSGHRTHFRIGRLHIGF